MAAYADSVFINCPFDPEYRPIFHALVFAVHDCGYFAHCAWFVFKKLNKSSGIVDSASTTFVASSPIRRVNCQDSTCRSSSGYFWGPSDNKRQTTKSCKIPDVDNYRFQKFCSDIAGQDISAHHGNAEEAIKVVRNWRGKTRRNVLIPSGSKLVERYHKFKNDLPMLLRSCARALQVSPLGRCLVTQLWTP
jgi:hypothetical protein